jgi:dienelactone hydrolase
MREDVAFPSAGLTLRGWLYRPAGKAPAPAIVMSHGFSAVKEQGLSGFAEKFRDAGFAVLVFDYRHLGASDGDDRGRVIPQEQHDDLRAAIAWLSAQDGVDPSRIGLWGTSYAGGHAMFLGLLDPRVKAIGAQAPAISVARSLIGLAGHAGFEKYLSLFAADHAARNAGEPGGGVPVVAPAGEPSVLSTPDSFEWFTRTGKEAGTWVNHTSLESVARMAEYLPAALVGVLAPKPLLLIAGTNDTLIPIAQVRDVRAAAPDPAELAEFPCGHFDFYTGMPFHEQAAAKATGWFARYL